MTKNQPRTIREIVGLRLREERERLGLTQTQFAELGNASKRSVTDWEQGKLHPNGEFLALLAEQGADINYIFTGERNISKLGASESTLLAEIRQLDEIGKDGLINFLMGENTRRHANTSPTEEREQQRESQLIDLFRQMSPKRKLGMETISQILFRVDPDPGTDTE